MIAAILSRRVPAPFGFVLLRQKLGFPCRPLTGRCALCAAVPNLVEQPLTHTRLCIVAGLIDLTGHRSTSLANLVAHLHDQEKATTLPVYGDALAMQQSHPADALLASLVLALQLALALVVVNSFRLRIP